MNLTCARGLPGSEGPDAGGCLATLDDWAGRVRRETDRHLPLFRRSPGEYENSEGYFRVLVLVTVLQRDLGVGYNPDRVHDPDFRDSRDLFIHGLLTGRRQGTCVSLPVLYAAVGRRLGYPLTRRASTRARPPDPGRPPSRRRCRAGIWFTVRT